MIPCDLSSVVFLLSAVLVNWLLVFCHRVICWCMTRVYGLVLQRVLQPWDMVLSRVRPRCICGCIGFDVLAVWSILGVTSCK